jgi:4-amino-4-deoxy-L-arabinose transferase-like glycosyltransferase
MKANNPAIERNVLVLCVFYLIVSLFIYFFFLGGKFIFENDTPGYISTAENTAENAFFSSDGVSPEYNRTPGYPLFLALIYFLGGNNNTAVILQIILSSAAIYLFYKTLVMIDVPHNAAACGAALLLFNVSGYEWNFYIMTESLFGFFLFLSVYFLVRYLYKGGRMFNFCLFSFSLNYALLIRPILIYFNALCCLGLLILWVLKRARVRLALVFAACFIVMFGGWSFRNYLHSSVFVFSTIQNHNVKDYYCPIITAYLEDISFDEARVYHDEMFAREYPEESLRGLNPAQVNALEGKYGAAYILAHFREYLILNIRGFFQMMLRPGIRGYFPASVQGTILDRLASALVTAYLGGTYLLYIAGIILTIRKISMAQLFILILCAYLAAASAILGYARLRAPFFPLLLLAAVGNFPAVKGWIGGKRRFSPM